MQYKFKFIENYFCNYNVCYTLTVQHMYTMMHSNWAEDNPVYGDAVSFIKRNGTEGLWFSSNCSEENTVICMDKNRPMYMLPTKVYLSTGQPFNYSTDSIHNGSRHI